VYIQKTQAKTLEQNSDREIDRKAFNDNNTNVYQQNNNTQEHVIQSDANKVQHGKSNRRDSDLVEYLPENDHESVDGSVSSHSSDSSDRCVFDQLEHQELLKLSDYEDQTQDVRALVSAAIAKLTLVLSFEWINMDNPLGNNHGQFDNNKHAIPTAANANGRVEFVRGMDAFLTDKSGGSTPSSTGGHSEYTPTSAGGRPRSNSNADANKILEVLLNLIVTMSESSLLSIQYNANIASVYENNDSLFSRQNEIQESYNNAPSPGQPKVMSP
jgi:hypothetical protein